MNADAFSKRHPMVNFIFFLGAIGFGVVIRYPACLLVSFLCGTAYYLLLYGRKSMKKSNIATLLIFQPCKPLLEKLDRIKVKCGMMEENYGL